MLQHSEADVLVVSLDDQYVSIVLGEHGIHFRCGCCNVCRRRAHLFKPMRIRAREPLAAASDKARITKSDRHDVKKRTREMASHQPGFVWELNAPVQ